jgi:hypothetical protein
MVSREVFRVAIEPFDTSPFFTKGGDNIEVPTNEIVCIVDDGLEVLHGVEELDFALDGMGAIDIGEKGKF